MPQLSRQPDLPASMDAVDGDPLLGGPTQVMTAIVPEESEADPSSDADEVGARTILDMAAPAGVETMTTRGIAVANPPAPGGAALKRPGHEAQRAVGVDGPAGASAPRVTAPSAPSDDAKTQPPASCAALPATALMSRAEPARTAPAAVAARATEVRGVAPTRAERRSVKRGALVGLAIGAVAVIAGGAAVGALVARRHAKASATTAADAPATTSTVASAPMNAPPPAATAPAASTDSADDDPGADRAQRHRRRTSTSTSTSPVAAPTATPDAAVSVASAPPPPEPSAPPPPAPPPPAPTPPEPDDGTAQGGVRVIAHEHHAEVEACRHGAHGKVVVNFLISRGGKAGFVKIVDNTTGAPDVAQCLVEAIGRWTFPRPTSGEFGVTHSFDR